jgi:hypothetical protein
MVAIVFSVSVGRPLHETMIGTSVRFVVITGTGRGLVDCTGIRIRFGGTGGADAESSIGPSIGAGVDCFGSSFLLLVVVHCIFLVVLQ